MTYVLFYKGHYYLHIQLGRFKQRLGNFIRQNSDSMDELKKSVMTPKYFGQPVETIVLLELLSSLDVVAQSLELLTPVSLAAAIDKSNIHLGILALKNHFNEPLVPLQYYVAFLAPVGLLSLVEFKDLQYVYLSNLVLNKAPNLINLRHSLKVHQEIDYQAIGDFIQGRLSRNAPSSLNLGFRCGYGKTWLAANLIRRFCLRTLICCPTTLIAEQWAAVFAEIADQNIKYILSNKGPKKLLATTDINDCDILIIVDMHLYASEFVSHLNKFSMFVFDESHSYLFTARTGISKILYSHTFPISLFLSGTPRLLNVFAVGENYNRQSDHTTGFVNIISCTDVLSDKDKENAKITADKTKNLDALYAHLPIVQCIDLFESRNNTIAFHIKSLLDSGRKIMLLCEYVLHAELLYSLLCEICGSELVFTLRSGKSKQNALTLTQLTGSFVVISTIDLCAAGIDIRELDTLAIATVNIENFNIRQAAGRILRAPSDCAKNIYFYDQVEGPLPLIQMSAKKINQGIRYLINDGWDTGEKVGD